MGPAATARLFEKIICYTDASCDAEHIHILIDDKPMIPDRTRAIMNGSDEPVQPIVESGRLLEKMGADVLVFPCNTAHFYYNKIQAQLSVPVINMIRETAALCNQKGLKKVAVLGTDGTVKSQIYTEAMNECGIEVIYPSSQGQKQVVCVIYDQVKAGKRIDLKGLKPCMAEMTDSGAEAFILACTELSIAFQGGGWGIICL